MLCPEPPTNPSWGECNPVTHAPNVDIRYSPVNFGLQGGGGDIYERGKTTPTLLAMFVHEGVNVACIKVLSLWPSLGLRLVYLLVHRVSWTISLLKYGLCDNHGSTNTRDSVLLALNLLGQAKVNLKFFTVLSIELELHYVSKILLMLLWMLSTYVVKVNTLTINLPR